MGDAPLKTDLILKGRVGGVPITVYGSLADGEFAGFSGAFDLSEIGDSLAQLLESTLFKNLGLNEDGEDAETAVKAFKEQKLLGETIPEIKLESLGFGYCRAETNLMQVVASVSVGGSRCNFVFLKEVGNSGFIVGLDLELDEELFKNKLLSGLVGDISVDDLGIYWAKGRDAKNENQAESRPSFSGVRYYAASPCRRAVRRASPYTISIISKVNEA